jgi:NADH-quinone oxidoreductase subunit J
MTLYFYFNAAIAIIATALTMVVSNAVHALLYFIVSLLAIAVAMYLQGAPFTAALEVIVYAGAIMVLFVFVVMLLNIKPATTQKHAEEHRFRVWFGPVLLMLALVAELALVLSDAGFLKVTSVVVTAKDVAKELFTTYSIAVELASFLLLAGLIGAYHVGKKGEHRGHTS